MVAVMGLASLAAAEQKTTAPASVADRELVSWVDARVAERQPSANDKRFDRIGWAHTILDAQRLAKRHERPLFLFTHDGRMNVGRC